MSNCAEPECPLSQSLSPFVLAINKRGLPFFLSLVTILVHIARTCECVRARACTTESLSPSLVPARQA